MQQPIGGSKVYKFPAYSSLPLYLLWLPTAETQPAASEQRSLVLWSGTMQSREKQKVDLEREAVVIYPSFCMFSELTSPSNPALRRPMRITSCMFHVCLFNLKCSTICYRHTSRKGLSPSRALGVPGSAYAAALTPH